MIETALLYNPGPPPFVARERSILPCGCFVAVGVRVDRDPCEASTMGSPCSPAHLSILRRFNLALTDSLVNPSARPLIEVVDELLDDAGQVAA